MNKRRVTLRSVNLVLSLGTVFVMLVLVSFPLQPAHGQLRELEVKPEDPPPAIPVFRNFPDHAGVIIYSSITNLDITSNMGIVEDMSRPQDGRYIVIVGAYRQVLTVRAPGFQETRIQIPNMSAREVAYFSVEPKERDPVTGRGILILHSIPQGARITVDGFPTFSEKTPYAFTDWAAQGYRIRVELEKYEPQEFVITIPEGRTVTRTLELIPDHGFITVHDEGVLRVQYHSEGTFSRTSYRPGQPLEVPIGNHSLEFSREYYETETEQLQVNPGEIINWRPDRRPSYGQLRINANTQVNVTVDDNEAPAAPRGANYLNVEAGRKQVRVTAPNHVAHEFSIIMPPGGRIDTTITLLSIAEAQDLERRRGQPRGVIMAAADLAATEIWINGEMVGRGFANHGVITGNYRVEFRHSIGTRTRDIYVAPAQMEQVYVELRPSHTRAIMLNSLLPGSGHLYTNRSRGYIYGAAFAGAAVMSTYMWRNYRDADDDFRMARDKYRQAGTVEEAMQYHREMFDRHDDRVRSHDLLTYMLIGTAAIYTVNLLDILLTRPEYGYRTGLPPERFSLSVTPSGDTIPVAMIGYRRAF